MCFIHYASIAQNIKTYKGSYKGGEATYEYYENDAYERIYHGAFTYIRKSESGNKNEIKGQYANGLKVGEWKFISDNIVQSGNFKDDKLDGKWTKIKIDGANKTLISSCTFKDGKLIGEFYFNNHSDLYVEGNFNKEGIFDGKWLIKEKIKKNNTFIEIEDIQKYDKGILYWRLKRNIQTGRIIKKLDISEFVRNFHVNFDKSSNTSFIDGIEYVSLPHQSKELLYPKNDSIKYIAKNHIAFQPDDIVWRYSVGRLLFFYEDPFRLYYKDYVAASLEDYLKEYNPVFIIIPYDLSREKRELDRLRKIEEDSIRIAKVKAKHNEFLNLRSNTIINVEEHNKTLYLKRKEIIENYILEKLKNQNYSYSLKGFIHLDCDSNGRSEIEYDLHTDSSHILKIIEYWIPDISDKLRTCIYQNNLYMQSRATYPINIENYQVDFILIVKKNSTFQVKSEENIPQEILQDVKNKFNSTSHKKGKYDINYHITKLNKAVTYKEIKIEP
ncbi:MAG: hypothetical protein WD048_03075 [Chitinophagales bacterium]